MYYHEEEIEFHYVSTCRYIDTCYRYINNIANTFLIKLNSLIIKTINICNKILTGHCERSKVLKYQQKMLLNLHMFLDFHL